MYNANDLYVTLYSKLVVLKELNKKSEKSFEYCDGYNDAMKDVLSLLKLQHTTLSARGKDEK